MNDHPARRTHRGSLAGSSTGHQRHPVLKQAQAIIGPRDHSFRKKHQRSFCVDQHIDRTIQRRPVHSLTVDTESAQAAYEERLEGADLEHVPTGHREDVAPETGDQFPQRDRITETAMIGSDNNAVTRLDG